jgi:uncharacterized protein YutE (UPF0331/DUF86 family)
MARKPTDYHAAILIMGELGVLPVDFARRLAPIAGFRNILVHGYLSTEWKPVYENSQRIDDPRRFSDYVRHWLVEQSHT